MKVRCDMCQNIPYDSETNYKRPYYTVSITEVREGEEYPSGTDYTVCRECADKINADLTAHVNANHWVGGKVDSFIVTATQERC